MKYLGISVSLHAIFLIILGLPTCSGGDGCDGGQFKSKNSPDSLTIIPRSNGHHGPTCQKWYGGIGLTTTGEDFINYVAPGYPAEAAGIKVGDMIVSPPRSEIVGPPDTAVRVIVSRGTQILSFVLIRDKICEGQ